ncbi:MAG: hypothetical protein IT486_13505 [Gammaproteobacteria bacterium]|nr:hypothetical protein [Gammaproteobacteria bacterium]
MRPIRSFATAAVALVFAGVAQAATYSLTSVDYFNSFAGDSPVEACTGCGSATADTSGVANSIVTLSNVSWDFSAGGNAYSIAFDGTTTLALGTTLNKTDDSCNQTVGSVCTLTNVRSGMAGPVYYTGIANDNLTSCANDRCRVDVSLSGSTLSVVIKRALSESATSGAFQSYTLSFTAVPVPAVAWLFGSALGIAGIVGGKARNKPHPAFAPGESTT